MIRVTLDGKAVEFSKTMTILEAAGEVGIKIPTLCHNEHIKPYGGCRLCLVDVALPRAPDAFRLIPSCCSDIMEGHIIRTDTENVKNARNFILQLFLSRCPDSEELRKMAKDLGVPSVDDREALGPVGNYLLTRTKPLFETKCILCGLCVRVCDEITERDAISFSTRGMDRKVKTPFDRVAETCIGCGSCAYVCPTNAVTVEEAP